MTDPIAALALWLAGHVEWMRHRREFDEFLTDVEACARVVRSIARGPAESKFLGPCGAPTVEDHSVFDGEREWTDHREGPPCEGDVYAYRGARTGRCKTCGAEVSTSEREAWLGGEVRQHAFTARDIADAHGLNVKTIRTWAARGQLHTYWRADSGVVAVWTDPPEGEERERLHYVGDVLDLAAADAGRRATEQAKRARRAAVREAAEEASDAA